MFSSCQNLECSTKYCELRSLSRKLYYNENVGKLPLYYEYYRPEKETSMFSYVYSLLGFRFWFCMDVLNNI
jgi:hypothetical protein